MVGPRVNLPSAPGSAGQQAYHTNLGPWALGTRYLSLGDLEGIDHKNRWICSAFFGHCLVGGLVAIFYFPINIGFLIIPIYELIFFRGVATTNQLFSGSSLSTLAFFSTACPFPSPWARGSGRKDQSEGTNKIASSPRTRRDHTNNRKTPSWIQSILLAFPVVPHHVP